MDVIFSEIDETASISHNDSISVSFCDPSSCCLCNVRVMSSNLEWHLNQTSIRNDGIVDNWVALIGIGAKRLLFDYML